MEIVMRIDLEDPSTKAQVAMVKEAGLPRLTLRDISIAPSVHASKALGNRLIGDVDELAEYDVLKAKASLRQKEEEEVGGDDVPDSREPCQSRGGNLKTTLSATVNNTIKKELALNSSEKVTKLLNPEDREEIIAHLEERLEAMLNELNRNSLLASYAHFIARSRAIIRLWITHWRSVLEILCNDWSALDHSVAQSSS
ncbi:hypothetical protein CC78DRAFT_604398 [Lojkania enalia]|uniref:Uncharacterized protein n=1 Tax=Lojkania enalia TaxID=147567 RepID=A0A9P4KB71_9PLEO|nr:hypothetical protein CC78DRAFT_604398 [Didymosphaeria enalia]